MHGGKGAVFRPVPPKVTACVPQARVNFSTRTRGPANYCPKARHHKRFSIKHHDRSSERDQVDKDFTMKTFFLFFCSSPNMRKKSIPKKDNIEFGAKYSPDCCRISNASSFGCVSVPPKIVVPREAHYFGAGPVTMQFYCSARTTLRSVTI